MTRSADRTRLVLLFAFCPAVAAAQVESEGRIADTILSGENRGETRLGEDAWRTQFQGLYAEDGACGEPDAVWAFAPGSVSMGRTTCTALGKMTWEDGALAVPLAQCRTMAEDAGEIDIAVTAPEDGVIVVRIDSEERQLEACPPAE